MAEAIGKVMEDMSNNTRLKPRFKSKNEKPIILQSLLSIVTSIARTNLEVELIQRGGSLIQYPTSSNLLPKRDCIGKSINHIFHLSWLSVVSIACHTYHVTV